MHILLIYTGEFQTNNAKIGGIFQLNQAKLLSSFGAKVNILNPCFVSPRYIFKNSESNRIQKIKKIQIYKYYKKNILPAKIKKSNYLLRKMYENISLDLFEKYIKKNGIPDICHVFDIRFGLAVGSVIKKKYKVPFIFSEYSVEIANKTLPLDKNYINKFVKPSLNICDYIALPSNKFANKFKKYLKIKKNINILPPVIPPDLDNIKKKKKERLFKFIIISRLDKNKNIKVPVQAFSKIKSKKVKLTIIGNGPELNTLEKYLYDKRIKILKNLSRKQMLKELSNSNCIICSSFHETFGVGLVEAAYYGIPIISSKCEGPQDIINKKNGLLINNSEKHFKKAIHYMLKNKNFYKQKVIKIDIEKRFGYRFYKKCYFKIFNKIKC